MTLVSCYAAHAADAPLKPHHITRRAAGANDVQIDIEFCGVCHTDIHYAKNDWGRSNYPIVPGHEIVGIVRSIGPEPRDLSTGIFAKNEDFEVGCGGNAPGFPGMKKPGNPPGLGKRSVYPGITSP